MWDYTRTQSAHNLITVSQVKWEESFCFKTEVDTVSDEKLVFQMEN